MAKRALVLGGGGVAGIAWETGILQGITDESPATAQALLDADVLLGTSAGSTVAAQLGSGVGIDVLFARQVAAGSAEIDPGVNIEDIAGKFRTAMTEPTATAEEMLRRIGAIACTTATIAEPIRRRVIERRLPSHDWPNRVLRISAIDTVTGELVAFDRSSGVGLVDAVAASCAVPGAWPPVTIGDRRYIDGGVRGIANLALADDCDVAVVLVPLDENMSPPFGVSAAAEIAAFDGSALGVFADETSLAAFGANPLDPACRAPSARAGREQGRGVAAAVADFLGG